MLYDRDFQKQINSILIIAMQGIGNTLLFTPALRLLKDKYPNVKVSFLVRLKGSEEILKQNPFVNEIIVFNEKEYPTRLSQLRFLCQLKKRDFDISITAFPANRLEFNLISFLIGAPKRIANSYPVKKYKTFGFLNNIRIPILLNVHDVQQNIRLLSPLGILNNDNKELKLEIYLSEDELQFGEEFLREKGITASDFIVGIHPGSSMERGMSQKRLPKEKFAELCDAIIENYGCQILIFGGLDEEILKNDIVNLMKNNSFVVPVMSLRQTAGIISKCNLFISNDSSLMHIAVAMNVPTIGIFGPTDHIRTAPYGKNCVVVRSKISCSPCWLLSEVGLRQKCSYSQAQCLTELSVSEMLSAVERKIGKSKKA